MMGHLNSFSGSRGGNLNKNFPKIQMPGGLPRGGMFKLRFDWNITFTVCRTKHKIWRTLHDNLGVLLLEIQRFHRGSELVYKAIIDEVTLRSLPKFCGERL